MESDQSWTQEVKVRVNASMMPKYHGKVVCLLGVAHDCNQSGTSFQLKTSDNHDVSIMTREPLQEYIEGLVEVVGQVTPQNSIELVNVSTFPKQKPDDFDMAQYNTAIQLAHQCGHYY